MTTLGFKIIWESNRIESSYWCRMAEREISLSPFLSLLHTHRLSHTQSPFLSLSLSLSHTHSLSLLHTHRPSFSLSPSFPQKHALSLLHTYRLSLPYYHITLFSFIILFNIRCLAFAIIPYVRKLFYHKKNPRTN